VNKIRNVLQEELQQFHPRLWLARILMMPLPPYVLNRLRARILRLAGLRIGKGTVVFNLPTIVGHRGMLKELHIGENNVISVGCYFDLAAPIHIGDDTTLGPQVMLITGTHKIGSAEKRAADLIPLPIYIGPGVWIGARVTILPGVTVGRGAIIAAGALVNRDVAANTLVAGVPAKPIRDLSQPAD